MLNQGCGGSLDRKLSDVNNRMREMESKFRIAVWIGSYIPVILIVVLVFWQQRLQSSWSEQLENSEYLLESSFQRTVQDLRNDVQVIQSVGAAAQRTNEHDGRAAHPALPAMAPEI